MAKRKIKEAAKAVETKVEQVIEEVKEEATEVVADVKEAATTDVATFTIDRWHVLVAAIVVTVTALVVIL